MPKKTEAELRAVRKLLDEGGTYAEFPDGVTWADVDAAKQLDLDPFAKRKEELDAS
jgi:hypothetical protein